MVTKKHLSPQYFEQTVLMLKRACTEWFHIQNYLFVVALKSNQEYRTNNSNIANVLLSESLQ